MRTKHQNIKKFKKSPPYRYCHAPTGNPNKYASDMCCTYTYRRGDTTVDCARIAQLEHTLRLDIYFD